MSRFARFDQVGPAEPAIPRPAGDATADGHSQRGRDQGRAHRTARPGTAFRGSLFGG